MAVEDQVLAQLVRGQPVRERPEMVAALGRLSPRESEVLHLVAQGATNPEIAQSLFIGETTVKTHVSRIQTKLDARDRVHLVVIAHRAGLA